MDIIFKCLKCEQELEVDASGAGSEIQCPSCGQPLVVPPPGPDNTISPPPIATSAAAREEKHFVVRADVAPESLIKKPNRSLEVAAKKADKQMRIRCIKRTECQEVGKDHFDETVSTFLQKIGQDNIVSIHPITYSHVEMGGHNVVTDYGVMIIYKG